MILESVNEKQEFDFEPILNLIGSAKPLNGNGYFKVISDLLGDVKFAYKNGFNSILAP